MPSVERARIGTVIPSGMIVIFSKFVPGPARQFVLSFNLSDADTGFVSMDSGVEDGACGAASGVPGVDAVVEIDGWEELPEIGRLHAPRITPPSSMISI